MRKPLVPALPAVERDFLYPWKKTPEGLRICPACGYPTSKPEAHFASAVCLTTYEREALYEQGYEEALDKAAKVVALAGFELRIGPGIAVNVSRADMEKVNECLWAKSDVLSAMVGPYDGAPHRGGLPLTAGLRAAILIRSRVDPQFGAYVDSLLRLGANLVTDKDFHGTIAQELEAVKARQDAVLQFLNAFWQRRRMPEVMYCLTRLEAGLGLPTIFWGYDPKMRHAVVEVAMSNPERFGVGLAQASDRDDRVQRLCVRVVRYLSEKHEDPSP